MVLWTLLTVASSWIVSGVNASCYDLPGKGVPVNPTHHHVTSAPWVGQLEVETMMHRSRVCADSRAAWCVRLSSLAAILWKDMSNEPWESVIF